MISKLEISKINLLNQNERLHDERTGNETVVDHSLKEVKRHGSKGFPLGVYLDDFSNFQNGYICWHWHDEVQMTLILEGEFTCQVGNEKILMKPGDSVFINSCALHQIVPNEKSFGKLYSFIWKADLFTYDHQSEVFTESINRILLDSKKAYYYENKNRNSGRIKSILLRIVTLYDERKEDYQLRIYQQLIEMWLDICQTSQRNAETNFVTEFRDEERVKNAMQFMQEHFNENISLEDIAKATMISRSELCKSFRRAVDTSPKEFLIQYRIRQSMELLENLELRISDISEMMGFSSPSHYGSSFLKYVGCTPLQYRKNI